jgi:hypothetical protein
MSRYLVLVSARKNNMMRTFCTFIVISVLAHAPRLSLAEGLVYQLPEDGAWVRFDARGKGFSASGEVRVSITGSLTISSVGQSQVDGELCRWIEIHMKGKFQRNKEEAEYGEILKALIPEKYLKQGEDPRQHVLKAWKKDSRTGVVALDLEGEGAREIRSYDEIFHAPLPQVTELEEKMVESKLGKLKCKGLAGREPQGKTVFSTETRLHNSAPFGVVTFRYEKKRASGEGRSMTLTLKDFGNNATSELPQNE